MALEPTQLSPTLGFAVDTWATVAVARNADAMRYAVPLSWDGKWSDKALLWVHLRVEPLRRMP
jgi:hypothetical protein